MWRLKADSKETVKTREALFGDGELVHQGEADVVFMGGQVDGGELAAELFGSFPADLAAETGFIAAGLNGMKTAHEAIDESDIERREQGDQIPSRRSCSLTNSMVNSLPWGWPHM